MPHNWQEWLRNYSIPVDTDLPTGHAWGDDPHNAQTVLDLSPMAACRISGEDVEVFLQRQLTNDIVNLSDDADILTGYCNPRGRLIAIFSFLKRKPNSYLVAPRDILKIAVAQLSKFVFREKVKFEFCSEVAILGYHGDVEKQPSGLKKLVEKYSLFHCNNTNLYHRSLFGVGFDQCDEFAAAVQSSVEIRPFNFWLEGEISNGIPTIAAATSEKFLPQMVNLDQLNGVSFTKGCFPGQEIVARVHYKGQVKQIMRLLELHTVKTPRAGQNYLFNRGDLRQQGTVLSAVKTHADLARVSMVVPLEVESEGQCELKNGDAMPTNYRVITLPYQIGTDPSSIPKPQSRE